MYKGSVRILKTVFFCLCASLSVAQQPLCFQFMDSLPAEWKSPPPREAADSQTAASLLRRWIMDCRAQGYLSASVDTIHFYSDCWRVKVFLGPRLSHWLVDVSDLAEKEAQDIFGGFYSRGKVQLPVDAVDKMTKRTVDYLANHGYPFASVTFQLADSAGGNARWQLARNALFRWDTLDSGSQNRRIKSAYIRSYLDMKPGKLYRENILRDADRRLKALDFVEMLKPVECIFENDQAKPMLSIRDRKVNRLDLLIGFLPNTAGQKLLVTGQALIHLKSILGRGEEFMLQWQKLQPATQQLDVVVRFPYLFQLPFGVAGQFNLYKADSSWLSIEGDYGFRWLFSGNNFVQAGIRHKACWVTQADTSFIRLERRLPDRLDFSQVEFQLAWTLQRIDYFFNPRKGFDWQGTIRVGVKQFRKNNQILNMPDAETGGTFGRLYDTLASSVFTGSVNMRISYYQPLYKQLILRSSLEGAYIYSPFLTRAELFRVGGFLSLRGFDEQALFVPGYAIWTEDLRWLFSKNGYFYAGMQAAIIPHSGAKSFRAEFPFSFSAGASVDTKVGIFSLGYAVGKSMYSPLSLRSSKIHFGYINLF